MMVETKQFQSVNVSLKFPFSIIVMLAFLLTIDQFLLLFKLVGALLIGVYFLKKFFKEETTSATPVLPDQELPEDFFDFMDDDRPPDPNHDEEERNAELYEEGILQDECNDRNDEWFEERQH